MEVLELGMSKLLGQDCRLLSKVGCLVMFSSKNVLVRTPDVHYGMLLIYETYVYEFPRKSMMFRQKLTHYITRLGYTLIHNPDPIQLVMEDQRVSKNQNINQKISKSVTKYHELIK